MELFQSDTEGTSVPLDRVKQDGSGKRKRQKFDRKRR
jgi:hypothetical protein